ncbi:MAG: LCP family protein, partial [Clostridia bacterium]|nr:LCP family protein [Clostridia bacterium]
MEVPEGITSIALFGIDSREEDFEGLSDSIMIITVDAEHNSIKMVSVMRDSLVYSDGHGYLKINAAYE